MENHQSHISKKKRNEGNFEYLLHFEDRQKTECQRMSRKTVQDEVAPPTLTPKKAWHCGFLAYDFPAENSSDCGSTKRRIATRSKLSTLVFSLDNCLGKSFDHHPLPKRGGKLGVILRQLENTHTHAHTRQI